MTERIDDFLDLIIESNSSIVIKRLSANDTGATGAHQSGPYIPKAIAFALCPSLNKDEVNPDQNYTCEITSHLVSRENRLVWYNSGTRDECRITKWADSGKKNGIVQPSQTGGIVVLAFAVDPKFGVQHGWAWFCESEEDEAAVESRSGVIEPGTFWFRHNGKITSIKSRSSIVSPCALASVDFPSGWLTKFPDALEIVNKTIDLTPARRKVSDDRLVARRDCEFQLFKSVEQTYVLPQISRGFSSVEDFINLANSVTNRRKSRSGRSLELHLRKIFDEVSLEYSHGSQTEGKKTPDFLFPSAEKYHDSSFPSSSLKMLGVKTTCKDRWRQVISEADRIPIKHLATLQEGVSVPQFNEMTKAGIVLVVPRAIQMSYPKTVRPNLLTLEDFIKHARRK